MHQQLKVKQLKLDTVSRYNPLDLFSRDKPRALKAFRALATTPQNNFRLFVNGEMTFPDIHGKGSVDILSKVLQEKCGGQVPGMLDSYTSCCHLFTKL